MGCHQYVSDDLLVGFCRPFGDSEGI